MDEAAKADLLEVVAARTSAGRLAGGLHGGQQQPDQRSDDRDHDEQLYEREAAASGANLTRGPFFRRVMPTDHAIDSHVPAS
jgi:hypothetical protein